MKFETIILLIIAFNVVTALLQRRAKKARERAAGRDAGVPDDSAPPREPWSGDADDEDGGFQDPYGERAPRRAAENRRRREPEPSRPRARAEATRPERDAAKIPGLGKSILDQLARDLGLKVPESTAGSASRRHPAAGSIITADKPRIPARDTVTTASAAPPRSLAGSEVPRSRAAPGFSLRVDLRGPDGLREAFVLKEILDAPLSRRRSRGF